MVGVVFVVIIVVAVIGIVALVRKSGQRQEAFASQSIRRSGAEVDPSDIVDARRLLNRFKDSQTPRGGSDAAYSAIREIAQAGSSAFSPAHARSDKEFAVMCANDVAETGGARMEEPWHWLCGVARAAARAGDIDLLASVVFFTTNWLGYISSRIGMAGETEARLVKGVPLAPRSEILSLALQNLLQVDRSYVVIRDPAGGTGGPLTMFHVVISAALEVRKSPSDYHDPVSAVARRLTDRNPSPA